MKTVLIFILNCLYLFIASSIVSAAPGDGLGSIPAPGHAPTGLAFDGKQLWVADRLTDSLYALDPNSGEIITALASPGFDISAIAWDGSYLWCADREESRISKVDPITGITVRSFESPTSNPQGLAWDGENLWLADDSESLLCQISTDDGTTVIAYPAASRGSTGLTSWNGYLWCGNRLNDQIYLFEPEHGEIVFALDSPGKYVRGLATDGNVLWSVDYQDRAIYEQVIDDEESFQRSDSHTLDLTLTYEFRNYGPGPVPTLDVYLAVPSELENQKIQGDITFSPRSYDNIKDRWEQPVAHFHFNDLNPLAREQIVMTLTTELADTRWFIYPHKVGSLKEIPKEIRSDYLVDEDKYRIDDPIIKEAVAEAVGDEKNPYWMMRKIHKYIREHLHYELAGGWNVAPQVLTRGSGSCSEYTFLFIAMCRAAGIPARYVGSLVIRGDEASTDEVFHRWSQVYLPGYGWVHVDPQGGDSDKPAKVAGSIGKISNRFLITTSGGGASEYLGWNYNYDHSWTSRGPVKITATAFGEWSPVAEQPSTDEQ
ncbi:transglutaminase [bacterium]|nr:transglutaminase [bacterium]